MHIFHLRGCMNQPVYLLVVIFLFNKSLIRVTVPCEFSKELQAIVDEVIVTYLIACVFLWNKKCCCIIGDPSL